MIRVGSLAASIVQRVVLVVLVAALMEYVAPAQRAAAQEVGVHGWWVAGDANGARGLLGGGAYAAASPYPFLDIRVSYAAARRNQPAGDRTVCDSYRPEWVNCSSEPVRTESRLSNLEVGVVGWRSLSAEWRVGAGVSGIRHALAVTDLAVLTSREHAPVVGRPAAYAPGVSLHAQVAPRASPNAVLYGSIGRSAADFGRCATDVPSVCGRHASVSARLGVGYRFGPLFNRR